MTDKNKNATQNNIQPLFPIEGLTRVKPAAKFLGIGVSTFWLFVKQGRIQKPVKLSERCSAWQCEYIRQLSLAELPPAGTCHADETKKESV